MGATILLLAPDQTVWTVVSNALRAAGHETLAPTDASAVLTAVRGTSPDLTVIDLGPGDGSTPIDLARRVRSRTGTRFLFLGEQERADDLADFVSDRDELLAKPMSTAQLIAHIESMLSGPGVDEVPLTAADVTVHPGARRASRGGHELRLTPLEHLLLSTFMSWPNRVLSKQQLLDEVWGFDEFSVNLVEVYVSSLRRKMETYGPRLIHTIRGVGYVLRVPA